MRALLLAALVLVATSARADLISNWTLDEDVTDSGPGGNDGTFFGEEFPFFVEGVDENPEGAIEFDGIDDFILADQNAGLPVYALPAYSVALWVKGLPQNDRRVYSESTTQDASALFNIGTERTGATGQVDIFIRTSSGAQVRAHVLSQGTAFDGEWHHVVWTDENGTAKLYIDGQLDGTDFSYTKPDPAVFDTTSIGGIYRPSNATPECCLFEGALDDVRVYDHILTEEEIGEIIASVSDCPADGDVDFEDTHCDSFEVSPPASGDGTPGVYTISADGSDDSGDEVRYTIRAESDGGDVVQVGPQTEPVADIDLGLGEWTISVTVDDNALCPDAAADASCDPTVIQVSCPVAGDTHCDDLQVTGPVGDGPGMYSASVFGASDDSGDAITYVFTASNDEAGTMTVGPTANTFADFNIQTAGTWVFEARVDDDPNCPDEAGDSVCTEEIDVGCPAEGDTHCDDMVIEGPDGTPGVYLVTVSGASDDDGELFQYLFRAENEEGREVVVGPMDANSALLMLGHGTWTVSVTVDDNPLCDDQADDAVCEQQVVIDDGGPRMVSHWPFDGDIEDATDSGNDGLFEGGEELDPLYVDGFDGTAEGAILFDGLDDLVNVVQNDSLPITAHESYSIAMWVKGLPQPDYRVFSEGNTLDNTPLFNIGTQSAGNTGQVDLFIRGGAGVGNNLPHRWSGIEAFGDDEWHHIAWVDDDGDAVLYVDGVRDPTDYSYPRGHVPVNTTSIGGIVRAATSHFFSGAIDDVRVYNYAISAEEVIAIVPEPDDCTSSGDTHCDDLTIEGPADNLEGDYIVSVLGASDESGDEILYTFTATSAEGETVQVGPAIDNVASLSLGAGEWDISVFVDDVLRCRNEAGDARCSDSIVVVAEPQILISHWAFDGDLDDLEGANDGAFFGGDPEFVEDRDGNAASALHFDGIDDYVEPFNEGGLPVASRQRFTIAMWVRGLPQNDRRVWSEENSTENNTLFNIGTQNTGATGQVDLYIRNAAGGIAFPGNGHKWSDGIAFDGTWHHIAWVDDEGDAVLYIDGVADTADFSYVKPDLNLDVSHIGAVVRPARTPFECCLFDGDIDDVRAYSYPLSAEEVLALVEGDVVEPTDTFVRGDPNSDGSINLTDGINILAFLFLGNEAPACMSSADVDDSGNLSLTDAIAVFNWLFLGGEAPPVPGPSTAAYVALDCGVDPTPDDLGCAVFAATCSQ